MEVLAHALAGCVADLRLEHVVEAIDLTRSAVRVRHGKRETELRFSDGCLCTLPLPVAIARCVDADPALKRASAGLRYNRVRSVAVALRGPRPTNPGLWRYYTEESLPFTKLVHLVEFDPLLAPPDGWGLLAEVVERGEYAPEPTRSLIERVVRALHGCGLLAGCEVRHAQVYDSDPAYVVFTSETAEIVDWARAYFAERGITLLGRYGAWQYSSMAQVIEDGFAWAERMMLGEDQSRSSNQTHALHPR
jgi:protoporphyrinogen oxidase